jgi:protoporphyrinogen/coproporphyrinogen III oxidase
MKKKVHVVGGGFSGMTLALRLKQRGFDVTLSEKENHLGGLIGTKALGPGLAEKAAPSISLTPRVKAFLQELDLPFLIPTKKSKLRFIYHPALQRFVRFPLSFIELSILIFKFLKAKWRGKLQPQDQETLREWGHRVLGEGATELLLAPAMQGIYAGDPKRLSAQLVLKRFFNRHRKSPDRYQGLVGFPRGMGQFIEALEQKLKHSLVEIETGKDISEIPSDLKNEIVVLTTPPQAASQILKAHFPETARLLAQIQMSSLITATLNFPQDPFLLQGFGGLIPSGANLQSLGVLFNSTIFDRGWTFRSETWILGGATNETVINMSDRKIQSLILKEREILFGKREDCQQISVTRWPKALPHYSLEHREILEKLKQQEVESENKGLYLHGNYLGGIGLSQILQQSDELAERIFLRHGN